MTDAQYVDAVTTAANASTDGTVYFAALRDGVHAVVGRRAPGDSAATVDVTVALNDVPSGAVDVSSCVGRPSWKVTSPFSVQDSYRLLASPTRTIAVYQDADIVPDAALCAVLDAAVVNGPWVAHNSWVFGKVRPDVVVQMRAVEQDAPAGVRFVFLS
jgi:hypothetical protein